jgi:hypothetical protein
MAKTTRPLPTAVHRALRILGTGVRDARRRRRIPAAILAQRALIARSTLQRVEHGDPGVSIGTYASVLFALGLIERLTSLVTASQDTVGLALEDERLPQRVRLTPVARRRSE